MRETYDYKKIESELSSIADNPNFSDSARNYADALWEVLNTTKEPTKEEYIRRIQNAIGYLNCGTVHNTDITIGLLRGINYDQ